MLKILIPIIAGAVLFGTLHLSKGKISKKYICDSVLVCQDSTYIQFKLKSSNAKKVKYVVPRKKGERGINEEKKK